LAWNNCQVNYDHTGKGDEGGKSGKTSHLWLNNGFDGKSPKDSNIVSKEKVASEGGGWGKVRVERWGKEINLRAQLSREHSQERTQDSAEYLRKNSNKKQNRKKVKKGPLLEWRFSPHIKWSERDLWQQMVSRTIVRGKRRR